MRTSLFGAKRIAMCSLARVGHNALNTSTTQIVFGGRHGTSEIRCGMYTGTS